MTTIRRARVSPHQLARSGAMRFQAVSRRDFGRQLRYRSTTANATLRRADASIFSRRPIAIITRAAYRVADDASRDIRRRADELQQYARCYARFDWNMPATRLQQSARRLPSRSRARVSTTHAALNAISSLGDEAIHDFDGRGDCQRCAGAARVSRYTRDLTTRESSKK